MKKRIGQFEMSMTYYFDYPDKATEIFELMDLTISEIIFNRKTKMIEVIGESPVFDLAHENTIINIYDVSVYPMNPLKKIEKVSVSRRKTPAIKMVESEKKVLTLDDIKKLDPGTVVESETEKFMITSDMSDRKRLVDLMTGIQYRFNELSHYYFGCFKIRK